MSSVATNRSHILTERGARATTVRGLPFYYAVHLNMPCNQRCIMCVPDGQHARDVLPFDDFVRLFEQVRPYAEHLTLIGGEPFMYPWICEVLDLLADYPIAVTVNTNGTILNERVADRLLRLHELNIKCSIDAVTPETYHRIRGVDDFGRVTANVTAFAERARGMANMRIIPIFVVMKENLGEVVDYLDYTRPFAPHRVEFHPVRQVGNWNVMNGTGWWFDGRVQSCEFFRDEYNQVMRAAATKAAHEGIECEVTYL